MRNEVRDGWEFIQVAWASRFELESLTPHLPTRVTLRGSKRQSDQAALRYITDILKERKQDIESYLKTLDRNAFRNVNLKFESHDLPDVTVPTFVSYMLYIILCFFL